MAEVTMICVDNSSFSLKYTSMNMRHQADAFELYCRVKIQHNPENTVGVFTLCVEKPRILLPPTNELGKIRTFKRRIEGLKPGGPMNLYDGLDMATIGFMCGDNEKMKKRVVVFAAGTVVSYSERRLQEIGNTFKMNNIALDFVLVGRHINETSATMLKAFVATVNNNDNSHFLYVASPPSICQAILSPHLFPHFEEKLRRLAARGSVSMEMLREAIKKDAAMYCDENFEPQEMNKKDNQSAKPEKSVSELVALSLKPVSCLISCVCSPWLVCVVYVFLLLNSKSLLFEF